MKNVKNSSQNRMEKPLGVVAPKSFKDRKHELKMLHTKILSKDFEFVILFGRRRVGKTCLSLKSAERQNKIYFLSRKSRNAAYFKQQCVAALPAAEMILPEFEALFQYLKDKVDLVIIDEFPNLIQEDSNYLSIFQHIVDETLQDSSLKLMILGSSISIMKNQILNIPSPLYGRKTLSMRISPHKFFELREYFPQADLEEIIHIYGLADGIPYYLNKIVDEFWPWLATELKYPSFIRDEGFFLVQYEFVQSERYFSILEAIAVGKNQISEIAHFTKIPVTALPQYLTNLIQIEFITREIPVTATKPSKKGQYILTDNFLKFWFQFIYPNLESIDQHLLKVENIRDAYSRYIGPIFEQVVKQFVIEFRHKLGQARLKEYLPYLDFLKIGRWWWKDMEVDLVAFNPIHDKAIVIECKWKESVNPQRIAASLYKKMDYIRHRGEFQQKEYLILIFAKSFTTQKKNFSIGDTPVVAFDLEDMGAIMNQCS